MNISHILFLFVIFVSTSARSQDIIFWSTGDTMLAVITEVGTQEVRYKRFDNLNGPIYVSRKFDIQRIRYANGAEDIFQSVPDKTVQKLMERESEKVETVMTQQDQSHQGTADAKKHYKAYVAAGTGTLMTALVNPLAGLVPALICSTTPPAEGNLGYPDPQKMMDLEYRNAYQKEATRIKKSKVWSNWGIGLGVNFFVTLIILTKT